MGELRINGEMTVAEERAGENREETQNGPQARWGEARIWGWFP